MLGKSEETRKRMWLGEVGTPIRGERSTKQESSSHRMWVAQPLIRAMGYTLGQLGNHYGTFSRPVTCSNLGFRKMALDSFVENEFQGSKCLRGRLV